MMTAWRVKLFEAASPSDLAAGRMSATFVEMFGVQADGPDLAKRAAKDWLTVRGHSVRSINVSAADERMLVAYVAAGSKAGGSK